MLNIPVNNFFSHVGTEPSLPVYNQYFFFFFFGGGGGYVLLKDTTWRLIWGRTPHLGSNPRLLDPESKVLTTRAPRPIRFGGQDMALVSMLQNTVRCAGFHYQQVMTLVAGLGIVAFTEGLHNSSIFLVTFQV